jgi:hypothetical protein
VKATAFRDALVYTKKNANHLIENIRQNINRFPAVKKDNIGYGDTYEVEMELTGLNGKKANVMAAWLEDEKIKNSRLISAYVKKRK